MKKIIFMLLMSSILIATNLTNIQTIQTSFIQKIKNNTNNVLTYQGTMFAQKQNNLALWIYEKPKYKEIYYKNGEIVIIEPDLEQVTFAKLEKAPNIITILKNAKQISKNKLITIFNNTKYKISTDDNFVKYIEYKDEMQNYVRIDFINPKINQKIGKNRFVYKIPSGYDVLKQ
jgi:outer membrane lipoprotein carrier protein